MRAWSEVFGYDSIRKYLPSFGKLSGGHELSRTYRSLLVVKSRSTALLMGGEGSVLPNSSGPYVPRYKIAEQESLLNYMMGENLGQGTVLAFLMIVAKKGSLLSSPVH